MKKAISVLVSAAILLVVYHQFDTATLWNVLIRVNVPLLLASLALLIVIVFAQSIRLTFLAGFADFRMTLRDSIVATFAANALNLFLPGKLGDILKASLMTKNDLALLPKAVALGLWEKLSEVALIFLISAAAFALLGNAATMAAAMATAGIVLIVLLVWNTPAKFLLSKLPLKIPFHTAWSELQSSLKFHPWGVLSIWVAGFAIWALHFVQICLMAAALGVAGDAGLWIEILAKLPLAILAGLMPFTFSGIGTRDAALVYLLSGSIGAGTAAALGILFWLRYLIPGLLGSVFLPKFFRSAGEQANMLRRQKVPPFGGE